MMQNHAMSRMTMTAALTLMFNITDMEGQPLEIQKSVELLKQAEENSRNFRIWKNVGLANKILELLDAIPARGETHTPYDKIFLLDVLIDILPCSDVPRLTLSVLKRMLALFDITETGDTDGYEEPIEREWIEDSYRKWTEYIDVENVGADEWGKKYGRHLRFDPVERTEEWEMLYEHAESEIEAEIEPDCPRGMGFCHYYWSVKRNVLKKYGIDWRSPSGMNPGVMFD